MAPHSPENGLSRTACEAMLGDSRSGVTQIVTQATARSDADATHAAAGALTRSHHSCYKKAG
jgi:hypothetical protein